MSSSPSREKPRAPREGSLSPDKRIAPTGQPAQLKENTGPSSNDTFKPDGSDSRSLPQKSNSPSSRLAPSRSPDSEMRGSPDDHSQPSQQRKPRRDVLDGRDDQSRASQQRKPRRDILDGRDDQSQALQSRKPRKDVLDGRDDQNQALQSRKPRMDILDGREDHSQPSQPRKPSSQRVRPAPAEGSSRETRRPPQGRTTQPRPRMGSEPATEAYDRYPPDQYDGYDDENRPLPGSQSIAAKSRFPAVMRAHARSNRQVPNPSDARLSICNGNCAKFHRAKEELEEKDRDLAAARDEIKRLKRGIEAKREAMQVKNFAAEQKRQYKMEDARGKRENEIRVRREQNEHKRELKMLETPEERMAAREAKLQGARMFGDLATNTGKLIVKAHENNSQLQTAKIHQDMQAQTAARRQMQREGTSRSGQSPARSQRAIEGGPAPTQRRPARQDQDFAKASGLTVTD